MPLEPGTKLGPYEILAASGSGTTGSIYKASDTRLNRTVWIRVLPPQFSELPQLRVNFEREAQTIASLKHPHICALYDVGQQDDAHYCVTEYLEGETLRERLKHGALELEDALKIGIAIADALDKAHRQGINHRGLNPSNVMLTESGPKLLDFGLARWNQAEDAGLSDSMVPTRTSLPAAGGVPDEAAPYLAPEQLDAHTADARTDIFALGAILYEMVTGKPAFEGKTRAVLVSAIMTVDPDPVSKSQQLAPPALDYAVRRCLAKDPKERLQTAWDLMCQLQWIIEGGTQLGMPAVVVAKRQKQDRIVWGALAVVSVLAIALAWPAFSYFRHSPEPELVRFYMSLGGGQITPSISPNGRWFAVPKGTPGADILSMASVIPQQVLGENLVYFPTFSPDNHSIAFFDNGQLKRGDIAGGPSQPICEAPTPIGGATWNKDGVILFSSGGLIYRVLAAGGQATAVTSLDTTQGETEHVAPWFLPDGRHFLYLAVSSQAGKSAVYAGALESKDKTFIFASESLAQYAEPGYLLFSRERTVFAQPFNAAKLKFTGDAIRLAENVPVLVSARQGIISPGLARSSYIGVSQTGVFAYRSSPVGQAGQRGNPGEQTLFWMDRTGRRTSPVGTPGTFAGVDLSPDEKQIVVHRHEGNGGDLWIYDSTPGKTQRLTFDVGQENSMPVWSPDGKRIAFASQRNGKWAIYVKLADGTGTEEKILESNVPTMPMHWSPPDGKYILYWVNDAKTRGDLLAVPLTGDRKAIDIARTPADERNAQVSPNGKWVAYSSNETGANEIYIQPFPQGTGRWQVSMNGGVFPRWRQDGKELFFYQAPSIMSAEIQVAGASVQPQPPRQLFGIGSPNNGHATDYNRYAVSKDGQRFLIPQPGGNANFFGGIADTIAAIADGNGPINAPITTTPISVILNWPQLFKQK